MKLIEKKDVLEREGWTEEKIDFFLGSPLYLTEGNGYVLSKVIRTESSSIFEKFTTLEEAKKIKDGVEVYFIENTNEAVAKFIDNKPSVKENSLLGNLEKYKQNGKLQKEIIHWIKKGSINLNDKYELFTDGSLKVEGGKNIIGSSGWIRNQNGEVILEFAKNVDASSISSSYDFEIYGLEMGIKIIQSLGIKNVNIYSDSSGEMKTLSFMKEGFLTERMVDLAEVYLPLEKILKNVNVKFSYIPRDLNFHADNLSKIYNEEYKQELKEKLESQKEKGFNYESEDHQYYTNKKIKIIEEKNSKGIAFVQRYIEKRFYQFYINLENEEILSYKISNIKDVREKFKDLKISEEKSGMDSLSIALLTEELLNHPNEKINVVYPSLGIKCRVENITMIDPAWHKDYISLDKAINQLDEINFMPLSDSLMKMTKKWITEYNIAEHYKNNPPKN